MRNAKSDQDSPKWAQSKGYVQKSNLNADWTNILMLYVLPCADTNLNFQVSFTCTLKKRATERWRCRKKGAKNIKILFADWFKDDWDVKGTLGFMQPYHENQSSSNFSGAMYLGSKSQAFDLP